jgi:hypothetical protein
MRTLVRQSQSLCKLVIDLGKIILMKNIERLKDREEQIN